jgi:hypothetical protein
MVAALGKNDQKIYVVPSQNLVVVRMGESSGTIPILALSSFDNVLWQKLNNVFCGTLSLTEDTGGLPLTVYPNPSDGKVFIQSKGEISMLRLVIYDAGGRIVKSYQNPPALQEISGLTPGWYTLQADINGRTVPCRNKLIIYR